MIIASALAAMPKIPVVYGVPFDFALFVLTLAQGNDPRRMQFALKVAF